MSPTAFYTITIVLALGSVWAFFVALFQSDTLPHGSAPFFVFGVICAALSYLLILIRCRNLLRPLTEPFTYELQAEKCDYKSSPLVISFSRRRMILVAIPTGLVVFAAISSIFKPPENPYSHRPFFLAVVCVPMFLHAIYRLVFESQLFELTDSELISFPQRLRIPLDQICEVQHHVIKTYFPMPFLKIRVIDKSALARLDFNEKANILSDAESDAILVSLRGAPVNIVLLAEEVQRRVNQVKDQM